MEQEVSQKRAQSQLKSFLADCQIKNPKNKKIFEVGFGNGLFLNECLEAGLIPMGIEITKEFYDTVKSRYPDLNIILYDGGTFPLPDESVDFVVSYQVLEHVASIEHMFNECMRILKPCGIMYHICPNYFSFYEGHYKIIWLPFLNKTLGRLYLKLLCRYTPFYETLNLVKPQIVAEILKRSKNNVTLISLGRREFLNKFNTEQIGKVDQKLLQKILKLLLRFPTTKKYIIGFISWADLYYPITVIAAKN